MRGISAAELIAEMGTGWNLGNTMDSEEGGETGWGNPVTTKEMIDEVHRAVLTLSGYPQHGKTAWEGLPTIPLTANG